MPQLVDHFSKLLVGKGSNFSYTSRQLLRGCPNPQPRQQRQHLLHATAGTVVTVERDQDVSIHNYLLRPNKATTIIWYRYSVSHLLLAVPGEVLAGEGEEGVFAKTQQDNQDNTSLRCKAFSTCCNA